MDKTVKIRAFSEESMSDMAGGGFADGQNKSLELAMKDAQLEEEKVRSLEHLKTIVQLRENLKQEQAKWAEINRKKEELAAKENLLDVKEKELIQQETTELASKNAQLEAEKSKSLELIKSLEELQEKFTLEKLQTTELLGKSAELDVKTKECAALEARVNELISLESKVNELNETIGKIAALAATGKAT
jgi:DNA repair exonuclease SbcCD ATPase subunit